LAVEGQCVSAFESCTCILSGLGKAANKAESMGLVKPDKDQIRERLRVLREHRWSSYRAYGNYGVPPEWLVTGEILDRAGGRSVIGVLCNRLCDARD
jgi:hypothetical protein